MAGELDPKILNKETSKLTSNLNNLSKSLDGLIKGVKDFDTELKTTQQTTKKTAENTEKLNEKIEVLTDTDKEFIALQKSINKLTIKNTDEFSKEEKQLEKLKAERAKNNKQIKEEIKLDGAAVDSRKRLRAENVKLRTEIDALSTTDAEAVKRASELNEEIEKNTELINGNLDSTRKQATQIGDYKGQIGDLVPAFGAASDGVKGFGGQLLKLLKNPIVAIIAGIVFAITAIFNAFKKTQAGADKFDEVFAKVGATIDVVTGRLGRLANATIALFKGEFKKAGEIARGAFVGVKDEINNAIDAAGRIRELKIALEEFNIISTTVIANLRKQQEEQQALADDATRSLEEQGEAAKRAGELRVQVIDEELKQLRKVVNIIKEENKLKEISGLITREQRQKEADAIAAVRGKESELMVSRLENQRQITEIRRDALERELDFLIDGFDNVKTINERIIADDTQTIERRKQLFDETAALAEKTFQDQIKVIEQTTNAQINADELIKESNAKVAFEKVKLLGVDDIIAGRILEIIRERRIVLQDLSDAERDLNQKTKEDQIKDIEFVADKAIELEKKKLLNTKLTVEGRIAANEEFAKRTIEIELELQELLLDNAELTAEERFEIQKELTEKELELLELKNEKEEENEQKSRERLQERLAIATDIGNQIFAIGNQFRENERIALDNKEAEELAGAEGNEAAQKRIQEKFAKERAKLDEKQAKADKRAAIFNASINVAVAVTKTLANPFLAAVIAILGGIEIAAIASRPIPKFKHGKSTPFVKDTLGIVGDGFVNEVIEDKDGNYSLTPDVPTAMLLPQGSKIIPSIEQAVNMNGGMSDKKLDQLIEATKANKSQSVTQVNNNLTNDGFKRVIVTANSVTEIYDDFFRK